MKANSFSKQKVAIVYDRVNKWGGAERVLLTLHELFPDAPLYTSVYDPLGAPWAKKFSKVHTSFLQTVPFARRNHEFLAPLMPLVFETFDFSQYDLVISVTSEAAKGIITRDKTYHVSYCLTPTRYLWSAHNEYFKNSFYRNLGSPFIKYLRSWDQVAANRPDKMIGISTEVKKRIKKYYNRDVDIIFPPVETNKFKSIGKEQGKYFLLVSRLVSYKKVDLAINAFNQLKYPLIIVGTGREYLKLKRIANKNIKFVGKVPDNKLKEYYSGAKAVIFPQDEDFGIVAVESQASGIPIIAYKSGGSLDTVIDGKTGIFFEKQTVESLINAVKLLKKIKFNPLEIAEHSQKFSKERFLKEFATMLKQR